MPLTDYRTLGRSGLAVSPMALGTMTFGTRRWGSADDAEARTVFDAYVDAGGNFVDTADVYAGGRSEELVGRFVTERGLRDRMVLATKFGFGGADPGNPNAGGNGRKHVRRALEGSLRRLGTEALSRYAAGAVVNGSLKLYPGQWSPVKSTRDAADSTAAPSPVWG